MMEIVDDRYGSASSIITSQLPVDAWHGIIDEPTNADAILDRIVRTASTSTVPQHKTHDAPKSKNGGADD